MFVPEKLYNCVFGLTPDFQFNVWLAGWWYVEKKKRETCSFADFSFVWALTDSNRRPSACKADALNQLS